MHPNPLRLPRPGHSWPTRGVHVATIGAERLEAVLYERDELRARVANQFTCQACRDGQHGQCVRAISSRMTPPPPPYPPFPVVPCACTDCALDIPAAAAEITIPPEVWEHVVATLPVRRRVGGAR